MKTSRPFETFLSKLYKSSGWALFTMLIWELVEEGLESLIAFALTSALAIFIAKALSTLAIVVSTQITKSAIKKYLFPLVKQLIYKEGNDKMEKVKNFFKLLFANKGTIAGMGLSIVAVLQGTGTIDPSSFPAIAIKGFNITPLLYYVLMGIGIILVSFFPETWEKFTARINAKNAEKEEKAIIKEAQKEIANEQKVANQTQAQQEKANAKKEAEEKAKAEKEKADAEHRAKVEQAKAKLIADAKKVNNA